MVLNKYPKIDVHGETTETVVFVVQDFIKDNYKMKNNNFYIIHGNGSGILRKTVIDVLQKDKRVIQYKVGNPNIGCTNVWLKIDK